MAHEVLCRLCKKRFDTESEDAVVVGQKSYYHKSCYEDWKKNKDDAKGSMSEDFWYEAMVDYLYRDVKASLDFSKLQSQWKNFTSEGKKMTPKGIYFAVRYFYDIQKGDPTKALGGIGIVKNIYNEAAQYWVARENKKEGTLEAIIQQIHTREARPVQTIVKQNSTKTNKSKWTLDSIEGVDNG